MAHPPLEELLAKLQATSGGALRDGPDQLQAHRDLAEACPAFTPNLLRLARLLRLVDEPGTEAEPMLTEVHRLLEQAVYASDRSADALNELAYFLDTHRNEPSQARKLWEEGAAKALSSLEDAWAGLIRHLEMEKQLPQALELSARAEQFFPQSGRIMGAVSDARQAAIAAGILPPEATDL